MSEADLIDLAVTMATLNAGMWPLPAGWQPTNRALAAWYYELREQHREWCRRAHETPEHIVCRLLLEKKKDPRFNSH